MPFNKGDFTQQGVNGHVNATVRLNEKRLVNIDLTSNEEAEGCTIAGTVTDLLNDKVYPIGAGVSGNIEITENGENINVAPYATATVNVAGGGDIPTCEVTVVSSSNLRAGGTITIGFGYELTDNYLSNLREVVVVGTTIKNIPYSKMGAFYYSLIQFEEGTVLEATNETNCIWDDQEGVILITDGTLPSSITLTGHN